MNAIMTSWLSGSCIHIHTNGKVRAWLTGRTSVCPHSGRPGQWCWMNMEHYYDIITFRSSLATVLFFPRPVLLTFKKLALHVVLLVMAEGELEKETLATHTNLHTSASIWRLFKSRESMLKSCPGDTWRQKKIIHSSSSPHNLTDWSEETLLEKKNASWAVENAVRTIPIHTIVCGSLTTDQFCFTASRNKVV